MYAGPYSVRSGWSGGGGDIYISNNGQSRWLLWRETHHRGSHSTLISVCASYTELSLASLLVKYEGGIVIRVLLHFLDNLSNLAFAIVLINLQKKALVTSNTQVVFFGIVQLKYYYYYQLVHLVYKLFYLDCYSCEYIF